MESCIDHAREVLQEMGDLLADLPREEQLMALSEIGNDLPPLDPVLKVTDNLVPGCASATYVVLERDGDHFSYRTDSESIISKGYLVILTEAINGCRGEEIVRDFKPLVDAFVQKAKIHASRIVTRANVFENIFHFMQKKAIEALAETE